MDLRISALFGLFCIASLAWCGDMTVNLDDGRTAILHEDSTWEFKGGGAVGEDGTISLALPDGKTLLLKEDGMWVMGKGLKILASTKINIKLDEVNGTASASKGSVTASSKAATDLAIGKIVDRLKGLIQNPKVKRSDIERCVKAEIKEQQIETLLQKNNAVTANITLDRMQLRNVAACVEEGLAPPPPADSTKK